MALPITVVLLLSLLSGMAATFEPATSSAVQSYLTNASAGDTISIRGGTYSPPYTNAASMGVVQWTVNLTGSVGNLITVKAYPGETVRLDRQWRLGNSTYVKFQDIEFYDSQKGSNPTNVSYPNGPWLHFDDSHAFSSGNQWVNCYIHDVNNCWSGGTAGDSVRGCIIIYCGLTGFEHVEYVGANESVGNIIGWHFSQFINFQTRAGTVNSNIVFGAGQTYSGGTGSGGDILSGSYDLSVAGNFFYNYYAGAIGIGSLVIAGAQTNLIAITNNTVVAQVPLTFNGTNFSGATVSGNTFYMNEAGAAAPVMHRFITNGNWTIDSNAYYAISPQSVILEDERSGGGSDRYTFAQWRAKWPAFDAVSTSSNSSAPPNAVKVFVNQDAAKRAHVAVYNWTLANNVTVNLSLILSTGDRYDLYSAQNYGAGPIKSGIFSGSTISVPMTNLTVAPILYGTNWGLVQPSPISPEFGAFVVIGQSGATMNVTTLNVTTKVQ